jgi:hypothetical protein
MKNIHIIPTKNSSYLSIDDNDNLILHRKQWRKNTQHLYITSNDNITHGDFVILKSGRLCQAQTNSGSLGFNSIDGYAFLYFQDEDKKIILTTDPDLIKNKVQGIDDEFLEWIVKNPDTDFVKTEFGLFNSMGRKLDPNDLGQNQSTAIWKHKIFIPEQKPKTYLDKLQFPELVEELSKYYKVPIIFEKDETIEEAAIKYLDKKYPPRFEDETQQLINVGNKITIGLVDAFKQGAKWQQERSYNEEEVHIILGSYSAHQAVFGAEYTYDMWFEQFKKK